MLKTRVIPCLDVKDGPRPCHERQREQDQKRIAAKLDMSRRPLC